MNAAINALLGFIRPIVRVFTFIVSPVAFLVAGFANPQGWMNSAINTTIDVATALWPSTPDHLKVSSILLSVSDSMPLVGYSVVMDIFITCSAIFAISLGIRIYKLIPFKMT